MNSPLSQMRYPPQIDNPDPIERACVERERVGGSVTYKVENAATTKYEARMF